jgi:hypothetical protein
MLIRKNSEFIRRQVVAGYKILMVSLEATLQHPWFFSSVNWKKTGPLLGLRRGPFL